MFTRAKILTLTLPVILVIVGLLSGCGDLEEETTSTAFSIWPSTLTTSIGESRQFYAVTVANGVVSTVAASFSLAGDIGTITSGGLFSAEASGTGYVSATYVSEVKTVAITVEAGS